MNELLGAFGYICIGAGLVLGVLSFLMRESHPSRDQMINDLAPRRIDLYVGDDVVDAQWEEC